MKSRYKARERDLIRHIIYFNIKQDDLLNNVTILQCCLLPFYLLKMSYKNIDLMILFIIGIEIVLEILPSFALGLIWLRRRLSTYTNMWNFYDPYVLVHEPRFEIITMRSTEVCFRYVNE